MTRVDFYFNAPERLEAACRLAGGAALGRARLVVYAPEAQTAQRLDRMLWTTPATGFVPHCAAHDLLAPDTRILIASDTRVPEGCAVMLNLSNDCPPHFERFGRVLEVVSTDSAERAAGRARYRAYRDRGCPVEHHDLAKEAPSE